jgi:hypothetical protein
VPFRRRWPLSGHGTVAWPRIRDLMARTFYSRDRPVSQATFQLAKAARSLWRDNDAAGRAVGDGFIGCARFVERVLSGDDGR